MRTVNKEPASVWKTSLSLEIKKVNVFGTLKSESNWRYYVKVNRTTSNSDLSGLPETTEQSPMYSGRVVPHGVLPGKEDPRAWHEGTVSGGTDGGSQEVVVVSTRTSGHVRVRPPCVLVVTPAGHMTLLWLNEKFEVRKRQG